VIVASLVAQRLGAEPLGEQLGERVIAVARVAPVGEGFRQRARQAEAAINLSQEQCAAVAGVVAAGKIGAHRAGAELFKEQRLGVTVCFGRRGAGSFHGA